MGNDPNCTLNSADFTRMTGVVVQCVSCHSKSIRYRVTWRTYICNRCGAEWDREGNLLPVTPERK